MTRSVKGTDTEKNLLKSFAGESQARMRYTYFASRAKKDGFEQISAIFTDTANNEKEHAERFFGFLEGGPLEISATFPAGSVKDTIENLRLAAVGENEEHSKVYPQFAEIADTEGFPEISECFRKVAIAEKYHEARYIKFIKDIESCRVFKRDIIVKWRCRNCGYVYESKEALNKCPACLHPQAYMEKLVEDFI
ncbi:MAG: rubrerythrin family protein [Endomicrobium sp.]|jgi:rubrerythrin|nr:rubrerythrin family protein [Endomicrobium sp.]